jgi:hypothetical protein
VTERPRLVLAVVVACGVGAASYVLQRLGAAYSGEVDPKLILATEHIPFFWRLTLAGAHALSAGVMAASLVDDAQALRGLDVAGAVAISVMVLGALAMMAVP